MGSVGFRVQGFPQPSQYFCSELMRAAQQGMSDYRRLHTTGAAVAIVRGAASSCVQAELPCVSMRQSDSTRAWWSNPTTAHLVELQVCFLLPQHVSAGLLNQELAQHLLHRSKAATQTTLGCAQPWAMHMRSKCMHSVANCCAGNWPMAQPP
jgi:hypothetical protein